MAFVRVEQRSAHLAHAVRLSTVAGRNGPVAKATFTAISNAWRGSGEHREEEATAILWTMWGHAAENAAQYLSKGSHVNISGRVQNNNYDREGVTVYGMAFTAEQVDYLDSKATSEALRARQEEQGGTHGARGADGAPADEGHRAPTAADRAAGKGATRHRKGSAKAAGQGTHAAATAAADDDIPF